MSKNLNWRNFIKTLSVVNTTISLMPRPMFDSMNGKRVKLGFIGTGLRGQWALCLFSQYPVVEISAICVIDEKIIESALKH